MTAIRVLIADDHEVVREGLARVIAHEPDMCVAALAADGEQAVQAACEHAPHVAVIDMRMPKAGGVAAIRQLRERCPATRLLVLSMYEDERYTKAALDAGAHGYVSKRAASATLLHAIRALHAGERFVDAYVVQPGASFHGADLSLREREVLRLLLRGHAARVIAEQLGIHKSTVETYRARIFEKVGVKSRVELLARLGVGGEGTPELD
jgi:DNA-binding NarL/FixJ family response regulator